VPLHSLQVMYPLAWVIFISAPARYGCGLDCLRLAAHLSNRGGLVVAANDETKPYRFDQICIVGFFWRIKVSDKTLWADLRDIVTAPCFADTPIPARIV
jgi:hypothetical protein